MGRRFATLAAAAMLTLAVGATPVLAESHGPRPVVTRSSSDATGMTATCGADTYRVTKGTSEEVVQTWPATATGDVHGIETWTLKNVLVVDQRGRQYSVVGSQQFDGTYNANTGTAADGPFSSYKAVQKLKVKGTRDGSSLQVVQLADGTFQVKASGTCARDPWTSMLW